MDPRSRTSSAQSAQRLQERLITFAAAVGAHLRQISPDIATTPVLEQLARASASPAANYAEACAAQSRRHFIHKMHICLGELRETRALLIMLGRLEPQGPGLPVAECDELIAIFVTSIKTARRGLDPRRPHKK
jgi:four helix bundle protein